MYKDKAKQREANRERQRRYKLKQKALLNEGVTGEALPMKCPCCGKTFPKFMKEEYTSHIKNCPAFRSGIMPAEVYDEMEQGCNKPKFRLTVMERLFYRPASELRSGEHNFVSLPGRACYG
jgi:hypothetical protein